MKSIHGLLLAIGLGVVGAIFNSLYLADKSRDVEKIAYIGIKPDTVVERGEILKEEHLVPVEIPKPWIGNLDDFAVPYSARETVIGQPVARTQIGGSLLLDQDLRTPPPELKIGPNERVIWIPVDTRTFVPSLVNPGDEVSFLFSPAYVDAASAGGDSPIPGPTRPTSSAANEIIGPFEVLSLGNRLASFDVFRAARIPQSQENVMAIRAKVDDSGVLETKYEKLTRLLSATNFRPVGIMLHPPSESTSE